MATHTSYNAGDRLVSKPVKKWHWLSISIHWLSLLLVLGLFTLGLWMVELTYYSEWYRTAPDLHKSFGFVLFSLTVFRLLWLRIKPKPEPLAALSKNDQRLAVYMHKLLYLLLFSVMFFGYLISTADGRGIEIFNVFEIPAIITGIDKQEDIAGLIHLWLAISLLSFVLLHALAALKHHFINKDRTFLRMLGR